MAINKRGTLMGRRCGKLSASLNADNGRQGTGDFGAEGTGQRAGAGGEVGGITAGALRSSGMYW